MGNDPPERCRHCGATDDEETAPRGTQPVSAEALKPGVIHNGPLPDLGDLGEVFAGWFAWTKSNLKCGRPLLYEI